MLTGSSPVGDAEQIAERQHARARFGGRRCRQIEMWQLVVARIELQHGDFGERIGGDVLGRKPAAVVEHDRHFVGIEHVAPHREHVPFGGDQEAALIGFQAAEAARAVKLDDLRLHLPGDVGERRRAVAGPRIAPPQP